jgi:translation initiation factor IF-2
VLVVAADDGVMPQTVEAINHAKAAGVPIVVALNKIDVPNANVNRALGQLAEHGLQPRQWGGETEVIETSAINGDGMDTLVETLSLEAELLELQAEYDAPASGYVIEGEMDPGRGVVARLLVLNGTLKVGDPLICGNSAGRVRQILDDRARSVEQTGPATPVEVTGLDSVPNAGDRFYVTDDIDQARTVAEHRVDQKREKELALGSSPAKTLENLFSQIEAGQTDELTLIVKADVQGSLEALRGQLEKLSHEEIRVNVLHAGVGGVNTGDVTLAEASNAMIIAFNVVADASARRLAESKNVEIRNYRVIYDITEDIRKLLEEGLAPEIREETLGRAEIRQVFKSSKVGNVAGCMVTDGVVQRNALVRITRDNVVVEDGRQLDSLRRYKDDVREVRAGMECGLVVAGYDDVKEGDILEFYKQVEVARTL